MSDLHVQRLTCAQALAVLQQVQPNLGRKDGPTLGRLMDLCAAQPPDRQDLPLDAVFGCLWPQKTPAQAMAAFRAFKQRLNQHLARLAQPVRLAHPGDNRPVSAKTLWIERELTANEVEEKNAAPRSRALAERLEQGQDFANHPDTPAAEFIEPEVTLNLPLVTFPGELKRFAESAAPEIWSELPEQTRQFLVRLGTKLDPITLVVPVVPGNPSVMGFECLAIGPCGENYGQILRAVPDVAHLLVSFLLAVVQVKTAESLQAEVSVPGQSRRHLLFTINLTQDMLDSPLLGPFLDRYQRDNILFELNEKISNARSVRRGQDIHQLRLVLDDWNSWKHRDVGLDLEPRAEWTKIDARSDMAGSMGFQDLMEKVGDGTPPERIIQLLKQWILPNKPLVIEGVEQADDLRFLQNHWREAGQLLYGQGHGLVLGDPWRGWLASLKDYGLDGGFILADAFPGEVNRIVLEFLAEKERESIRRDASGPLLRLEVPMGEGDGPLVLWVVGEKLLQAPELEQTKATLRSRMRRGEVLVVPRQDARLPGVQILKEELPGYLRLVRSRTDHARQTLATGPHRENYPEDRYLGQRAECCLRRVMDTTAAPGETEPPASGEGRAMLFNWLEDPASPPLAALLGEFGMGKTFLVRMFAGEVIRRRQRGEGLPAPLYLDMRLLPAWQDRRTPSLEEMVGVLCEKAGFGKVEPKTVLAAVQGGPVFLIFDGLDEKSANMTGEEAAALLQEIRRAIPVQSRSRVLISCRTHYFLDQPDEKTRLAGGSPVRTREGWSEADCRIFYLQPFDETRIQAYLERLHPGRGSEILEFLKGIHNLAELAQRPFLLHLIASVLPRLEARSQGTRRIGAADIYQETIAAWLARDEGKHRTFKEDKLAFMEKLALELWRGQVRHLGYRELRQRIPRHLTVDDGQRWDAEMRTTSFITRDDAGHYGFAHTSFQEFFAARRLAQALDAGEVAPFDLPRLNQEIRAFLLDLLQQPGAAARALCDVLERKYVPQVSENLLLLALAWRRQRLESAPRPASWQLQGARLEGIDLSGETLEGVDFSQASLRGVRLATARIRGSFAQADLTDLQARDARLDGCDFRGARLQAADLAGASLTGADFTEADIHACWLQRAHLEGATFNRARLVRVRLGGVEGGEGIVLGVLKSCSMPPPPFPPSKPIWPLAVQSGHWEGIRSAAYSPDGHSIVSASYDKTVKVWDAGNGQLIRTLEGHGGGVRSAAYSPDGHSIVSASFDKTVKVWNAENGQLIRTLEGHGGGVMCASYSPDNCTIVSASDDKTIKVWDAKNGQLIRTLEGHEGGVRSVSFMPNNNEIIISASDDKTIKVWNAVSGRLIRTLEGHESWIMNAIFSPDCKYIISASDDNTLKIWESNSEKLIRTLEGHKSWVMSSACSPDGKTITSASEDKTLKVWNVENGYLIRTLEGHGKSVLSVAFSPDGQTIVSASDDGSLKVWEAGSGRLFRTLEDHGLWVRSAVYSPDGKTIISASDDGTLKVYNAENGKQIRTLEGHGAGVRSASYSPDGRTIVSASDDRTLKVWEVESGRLICTLKGHEGGVRSAVYSPDGKIIVSASHDRTLKVWKAESGQLIYILEKHKVGVRSAAYSPNGESIVSASYDKTLNVWEAKSGRLIRTMEGHEKGVMSAAYSPDGKSIVSASDDRTLKVWSEKNGRLIRTMEGHEKGVMSAAYSPDGKSIVSASDDRTLKVWEAESGRLIRTLEGHEGGVRSAAYSPDGQTIVSASFDKTLKVWNAATGRCLATLWGWADGGWLALPGDGSFDGNPQGLQRLGVVHNDCVYPAEEFPDWRRPLRLPVAAVTPPQPLASAIPGE
ncbi:MAG: pentapeptide repeat-containing protein [Magnetococcales bacterium]|nr:pentapeptide repeat-containing protein [Magnetococcales bacterium]